MKTLWTLIKANPVYKIFAGMVIALIVFAIFNVAGNCTGEGTSREQVIIQNVVNSVNDLWTKRLRAHEDSLQKAYQVRDSAWLIAYNNKKAEAARANKQATESNAKYNELKKEFAEPCKEVIAECDKRERIRITEIQKKQEALVISENRLTECKENTESIKRSLALADSSIASKNKTIVFELIK